jgi:hypothetical protein
VSNATFYASSSFFDPGAAVNSLSFGPGTVLDTIPTASIDNNAATDIYTTTVAGPVNVFTSTSTQPTTLIATLTVPQYPYYTSQVLTVTGTVDQYTPSSEGASSFAYVSYGPNPNDAQATDQIARNGSSSDPYAGGSFAIEETTTVGTGGASTYYLYATGGGYTSSSAYVNIYKVNMKVEVIKK